MLPYNKLRYKCIEYPTVPAPLLLHSNNKGDHPIALINHIVKQIKLNFEQFTLTNKICFRK